VPPYQLDHSLLTKAILNSDFDWEGGGPRHLSDRLCSHRPPSARQSRRRKDLVRPHRAADHRGPPQRRPRPVHLPADLIATDGFYERYAIDRELVEFGECRPDLLMITSGEDGW